MIQYIPKSAVVAEIEKRQRMLDLDNPLGRGGMVELQVIKDKIDALEVKEGDFEEELKYYCNNYYNCDYPKQLEEESCSEVMPHIVSAAKHFFELGVRANCDNNSDEDFHKGYIQAIEDACKWLQEHCTYTHPRKGCEECVVNIPRFRNDLLK